MAREHSWSDRLHCIVHGHDVSAADVYGETLANGKIEELHYCQRCGMAVWQPGHAHAGEFPESQTAHMLPDMVLPMAPPGSHQHREP